DPDGRRRGIGVAGQHGRATRAVTLGRPEVRGVRVEADDHLRPASPNETRQSLRERLSPARWCREGQIVPRQPFTALLSPEPAVKRGTRVAAIWMRSPVRGLTPWRAPRSATWNFPKPEKLTSPFLLRVSSITLSAAS